MFTILAFLILAQKLKEIDISNYGDIVKAEIVKMPESCSGKNIHAEFKFSNYKFTKRVWKSFCNNHRMGELVEFYHIDKYPEDFVFKHHKETVLTTELISIFLLILLFGLATYHLFLKE